MSIDKLKLEEKNLLKKLANNKKKQRLISSNEFMAKKGIALGQLISFNKNGTIITGVLMGFKFYKNHDIKNLLIKEKTTKFGKISKRVTQIHQNYLSI